MQDGTYPEVPPDFGHWLAGFIDGEGCFYVQRWTVRTEGYTAVFSLTVRDDDRVVVEDTCARTALGVVKQAQGSRSPRSNPTVVWRIWRKRDCLRLVELLDRYRLRSKKARDYELWRQIVHLWHAPRATRDWIAIRGLRAELMGGRHYEPAIRESAPERQPPARLF